MTTTPRNSDRLAPSWRRVVWAVGVGALLLASGSTRPARAARRTPGSASTAPSSSASTSAAASSSARAVLPADLRWDEVDAWLARGSSLHGSAIDDWADRWLSRPRLRPVATAHRLCGVRVCAHYNEVSEGFAAEIAIDAAEGALATLSALRLPGPRPDGRLGGDARLDVYLARDAEAATYLDPGSAAGAPDRGTAFVVAPPATAGCGSRAAVARGVVEAIALGMDAALEPGSLGMLGQWVGALASPCFDAELAAIDEAQRAPERTITGAMGEVGAAGLLLPWHLEERAGGGDWAQLSMSLASIGTQRAGAGLLRDEPDLFDVLRATLQARGSSFADTLLDLAVDRAFLGSRSDDQHLVDAARYGDLGRVRFEWSVDHASLPRRLAPLRPIEPLGASYVYVDLANAKLPTQLTFVADWEGPGAFRWALVKLDKNGAATSRTDVVPVFGETQIQKTLPDLSTAAALLIVGVNEGDRSRDEPFDPSRPRAQARSYLLTLYP
jgi:hypothetical protein